MSNVLFNRGIKALNDAGFQVVGCTRKPNSRVFKFKVTPDGPPPKEEDPGLKIIATIFEKSLEETIGKRTDKPCEKQSENQIEKPIRFPKENFNIMRLLGTNDWHYHIAKIQNLAKSEKTELFEIGDYTLVSFEVPAAEHNGVKFPALKIENAKVVIVEKTSNRVIFNFDEIIFKAAINAKDTNKGGISESALSSYLNNEVLEAMGVKEFLVSANNGTKITLPTAYELFGETEYWESKSNFFEEPRQFDYFKNEKNRVKTFEDETHWYWTSSPCAASSAGFDSVYADGDVSNNDNASSVGGVAPAFCVA